MTKSQYVDNLSKYNYDISKLVMGIAVIGNLISEQFSSKALWIGLGVAVIFLMFGYILDRLEVLNNDQH